MASVYADPKLRNKRHYIAASTFNSYVYGYSTTMNSQFVTTGALTVLPSATTNGKCPQGRILREVGNRLYPDAHPGVSTMMVQVYDANSGVRGYIDPNAPVFAVYNSDKPVEIVDGTEVGTTTAHKGQPVFTTGDVIAGGDVKVGSQVVLTGGNAAIPYAATNSPYAFGSQQVTLYSFAATGAVNLNATSVPPNGTVITIYYSGAFTTTPATGFVGATVTPTGTQAIAVTYISNGTVLIEMSRSGALPTVPTLPAAV
jgi:hypothetical protein